MEKITEGMTGQAAANLIISNDEKAAIYNRLLFDDKVIWNANQKSRGVDKFYIDFAIFAPYIEGKFYSFAQIHPNGEVRLYQSDALAPTNFIYIGSIFTQPLNDGSGLSMGLNPEVGYIICDFSVLNFGTQPYIQSWPDSGAGISRRAFKDLRNVNFRDIKYLKDNLDVENLKFLTSEFLEAQISPPFFEFAAPETTETEYDYSTFSAWGCVAGPLQNISVCTLKISARAGTSGITAVRFRIREATRSGTILADVTRSVNIEGGATSFITFSFEEIANASAELLWIEYLCDNLCDFNRVKPYPYANKELYASTSYKTDGQIEGVVNGTLTGTSNKSFWFRAGSEAEYNLSQAQIDYIASQLEISTPTVDLILPDKFDAVVGDTLQIFYRGLIKHSNPYFYNFLVTSSKGAQYPRYFEYTPKATDVGTAAFKFQLKDDKGALIGEATSNIVTKDVPASPAAPLKVVCFGDSLTNGGRWVGETFRRLTGSGGTPAGNGLNNIDFCGPQTNNGAGYYGKGGWTWSSYSTAGRPAFRFTVSGVTSVSVGAVYTNNGKSFTVAEVDITAGTGSILTHVANAADAPTASGTLTKTTGGGDATITFTASEADAANPFWDGIKVSFIPFANAYCGGTIDVMYSLMTWNGRAPYMTNFDDDKTRIRIILDALKAEFPNARYRLMGVQLPSITGGMGANYGATGATYANAYGMYITALNMNKAYQDLANEAAYVSWVQFVNVTAQTDVENNMPGAEVPVNTRSTVTEIRGTNGVHPADAGYLQIGDAAYRNFINSILQ